MTKAQRERRYFDVMTAEIFYDHSDDEHHEEAPEHSEHPLRFMQPQHEALIKDSTGISSQEVQFMILWNRHMLYEDGAPGGKFVANRQVITFLKSFLMEKIGDKVIQSSVWRELFVIHVRTLYKSRILSQEDMRESILTLAQYLRRHGQAALEQQL